MSWEDVEIMKSCAYYHARNTAAQIIKREIYARRLPRLSNVEITCADCSARATEYDHRDYSKPKEVTPVCHRCNVIRGEAKFVE